MRRKLKSFKLMGFMVVFLLLSLLICIMIYFLTPKLTLSKFTYSDAVFLNPLKGYSPWAMNLTSDNQVSLAFALIFWSDFESEKGVYDFEKFEADNNFAYLRSKNIKVTIRFVCDYPTKEKHMDIPSWLFDEMEGDGSFYETNEGQGFVPNYENPLFIDYHEKAILALGERYDNSPDIAFVQLGSLGQWGEWHNAVSHGQSALFPKTEVTNIYVEHYLSAFKEKKLQMRRPFDIAKLNGVGLYNDMIGHEASTQQWISWFNNGYDSAEYGESYPAMEDFWITAPSGGEFGSTNTVTEYFSNLYPSVKNMIIESHTTFIGGTPPAGVEFKANSDDLIKTMGYRFTALYANYSDTIRAGKEVKVSLCLKNTGVAPFYYEWPAYYYMYDSDSNCAAKFKADMDIREILPGVDYVSETAFKPDLPEGDYLLRFGFENPHSGIAEIKLANNETWKGALLEIGNITVK